MFVIKYIKKQEATTHPRPVLAPDFCIAQTSIMARKSIVGNDITVCAVLSGNRNFEGRVHPLTKANWLASPPLVVCMP